MRGGGFPAIRRLGLLGPLVATLVTLAMPAVAAGPAMAAPVLVAARTANPTPAMALLAAVRSAQTAVVDGDFRPQISAARAALSTADGMAATARFNLGEDSSALSTATQAVASDRVRLASDLGTLAAATSTDQLAQARLAADRVRLRALAIEMYTGGDQGVLLPDDLVFPGSEQSLFDRAQVSDVVTLVFRNLHADVTAARQDAALLTRAQHTVARDRSTLTADQWTAEGDGARVTTDQLQLASANQMVSDRSRSLTAVLTSEAHTMQGLVGPEPTSAGLSIVGPSTLTAAQLAAWYAWSGYADLTPATISQLAGWYVQAGRQLGVRGDVAFAQATLETGGFSSPDSVQQNNYAGIGHCDTCAVGWAFPSPHDGVLGQLQLLRIFATSSPAPKGSPAPVLPALSSSRESRRGCCPTWEALTGTWATDPSYGAKVLSIYQQMLQFTVQGAPPAPAVPALVTGS